MKRRTKTGLILVGVGLLISIPSLVIMYIYAESIFQDKLYLLIPTGIGFLILFTGMSMLKVQLRKAVYGDDRFSRR